MSAGLEDSAVGARFEVRVQGREEAFVGELFAYDSGSGMVAFQSTTGFPKRDIIMVREDSITSLVHLSPGPEAGDEGALREAHLGLNVTPVETIRSREAAGIRADMAEAAKIGVGVSTRAQAVFDVLSKTMPASWDGTDIKVLDVTISSPYNPEDATGPNAKSRNRIQLILNKEKDRIEKIANQ